jgi:hypothetical protein
MRALNNIRTIFVVSAVLLTGCATSSDIDKSVSRDKTMSRMAETALIAEMLNSPDPVVRAKGAEIADKFLTQPKKNLFGF